MGGECKGVSGVPWRQQKSHFHSGVWFLFIYLFPLCFFIYTVCGAGVKIICISISGWLQALSNDTLFHTIQRAIISPPPLSPLPAGSSHTHTHTLTHTRECNYMTEHTHTHTVHFHPGSIVDSILCKAGTEVQVGRGKWRGGTFPEGVSWYVIVLVSTQ